MLNETEYREALGLLSGAELQKAVRHVNSKLKQMDRFDGKQVRIDELVQEAAIRDKNIPDRAVKKVGVYQHYYLEELAQKHKTSIRSQAGKKNAIQYLLLFYRECRVQLRFVPGPKGYKPYESPAGDFVINELDDVELAVYDLFYWRTNRDDIGIGKLRLVDGWQRAELVYHYRAVTPGREQAYLSGPAHWCGDNNLYIHLQDTTPPGDTSSEKTHVFISLYVHRDANKRQYLTGVFASANRDTHDPICGMVLLQRNDTNPAIDQSDFLRLVVDNVPERVPYNIPSNVFHAVSNQLIKVAPRPVLDSLQVPYTHEVRQLENFVGTYQVYQPQPADCLRLMKLDIEPDGRALLTRKNSVEAGYVDYCAGVVMLKFDYSPETASYRFYLILEKAAYEGDMMGIYAGLDNENIVSTRLYIQRVAANHSVQLYEQRYVNRNLLSKMTLSAPAVVAFLTDPRLTTTDAFWTYRLHGLAAVGIKPSKSATQRVPMGQYNAFFLTPFGTDETAVSQRVQLVGLPLLIAETEIIINADGRRVQARVVLNDENQLTIQADEPLFDYRLVIDMPEISCESAEQGYARLAGFVWNQLGSGSLMLCRETDEQWLTYRIVDQLADILLLDRRYPGLASFLFDEWAQPASRKPTAVMSAVS